MGFYADQALPRILNAVCAAKTAGPLRRRVCAGLSGEVVEIGFGSGHNVPFYPPGVTGVAAVEPSDVAWRLAAERVRSSRVPVRRAGLDGQSLPFEDGAFDSARPPGPCAPSRTPARPCASCAASSSPGGPCTSSNTGSPRKATGACAAGSDGSSPCRNGSSAGATSPGPPSTC
ncbi:class I SAM-dependent methyltransferase [Streptomyces sp. MS1.HAVA.3]|uniref:Class I SAM-dependent methyltransferase n=1 Tax=Streptomyces caledonius TaxID=3134107 RepID=A0ABU8U2X0_9ACTN